jgi:hypothetical protein
MTSLPPTALGPYSPGFCVLFGIESALLRGENNRRVHLEQTLGPAPAEVVSIWC